MAEGRRHREITLAQGEALVGGFGIINVMMTVILILILILLILLISIIVVVIRERLW